MTPSKGGKHTVRHDPENPPKAGTKNTGQGSGNVLGSGGRTRAESGGRPDGRH
jgi:hypothetical protein